MNTQAHTPTPWLLWQHVDGDRTVKQIANKTSEGKLDEFVAANVPAANAELIVRAVNNHAALLDACKATIEALENIKDKSLLQDRISIHSAYDKLRSAISNAS